MQTRLRSSLLFMTLAAGACSDLEPPDIQGVSYLNGQGGAYSLPMSTGGKASASTGGTGAKSPQPRPTNVAGGGSSSAEAAGGSGAGESAVPNAVAGRFSVNPGVKADSDYPIMVRNLEPTAAGAGAGGAGGAAADTGGDGGGIAGGAGGAEPEEEPPPACRFSAYVEGTKNLKALAVACSDVAKVDDCVIENHANGAPKANRNLSLSGVIDPAAPRVICSPELAEVEPRCDLTASLVFNGNDALVLTCKNVVIDSFGQLGAVEPPGDAGWGAPVTTTTDISLSRLCDSASDTDVHDEFDPTSAWVALGTDVTSALGWPCTAPTARPAEPEAP
jgi:hypothetical protein